LAEPLTDILFLGRTSMANRGELLPLSNVENRNVIERTVPLIYRIFDYDSFPYQSVTMLLL